jgi:hypothetical protein
MTSINPGDLVIAVPIHDCAIGHPAWHEEFSHPEMNSKSFMVTWAGFSHFAKRPIIRVAGRRGRFCAGCFAKQDPGKLEADQRRTRFLENA